MEAFTGERSRAITFGRVGCGNSTCVSNPICLQRASTHSAASASPTPISGRHTLGMCVNCCTHSINSASAMWERTRCSRSEII